MRSIVMCGTMLALLTITARAENLLPGGPEDARIRPDPRLTPGAVTTPDPAVFCHAGYSRSVRHTSGRVKQDVFPSTLATDKAPNRVRHASPAQRPGSARSKAPARRRPAEPAPGPDATPSATARTAAKLRRPAPSFAAGATQSDAGRTQAGPKGRASRARASQATPSGGPSRQPGTNGGGGVSGGDTPLRIPYGNKEAAQALGARYWAGRWYAPADVPLTAFRERGWL